MASEMREAFLSSQSKLKTRMRQYKNDDYDAKMIDINISSL